MLEDGKSLAELKVENDDELAVAYRTQGRQAVAVAVPAAVSAAAEVPATVAAVLAAQTSPVRASC